LLWLFLPFIIESKKGFINLLFDNEVGEHVTL